MYDSKCKRGRCTPCHTVRCHKYAITRNAIAEWLAHGAGELNDPWSNPAGSCECPCNRRVLSRYSHAAHEPYLWMQVWMENTREIQEHIIAGTALTNPDWATKGRRSVMPYNIIAYRLCRPTHNHTHKKKKGSRFLRKYNFCFFLNAIVSFKSYCFFLFSTNNLCLDRALFKSHFQ